MGLRFVRRYRPKLRRLQQGFMNIGMLRSLMGGGAWGVRNLFRSGEQGVWYDPSDFSSMYQDSAGTTPVTAVEQPVGFLMDLRYGKARGAELTAWGSGFTGLTGVVGVNASTSLVSGEVVVSATNTTGSNRGEFTIAGLIVDKTYEVKVVARRGAQGTGQAFLLWTIGTINQVSIAAGGTAEYPWRIRASATTGLIRVYATSVAGAVGDEVIVSSISVKEIPGNHATQATSASRPMLSARYNLLTKSEQFDDVVWTKVSTTPTANSTTDPLGGSSADTLTASGGSAGAYQLYTPTATAAHRVRVYVRAGTCTTASVGLYDAVTITFKATSATIISGPGSVAVNAGLADVSGLTSAWTLVEVTGTLTSGNLHRIYIYVGTGGAGGVGNDIRAWGADLRFTADTSAGIPAYQRVNTATDYDTAGFLVYLMFDGVDDSLQTASIDFTGTDKMTVWAGLTKLSDAVAGVVCELSAATSTNNGAFYFSHSPGGATKYGMSLRGTTVVTYDAATYAAPVTNVITLSLNIAGATGADEVGLRINAATAAVGLVAGTDAGTGNFGNYALNIGRRNNTSSPFNGRLYQLIGRGAATDSINLTRCEAYVAGKTGVTL